MIIKMKLNRMGSLAIKHDSCVNVSDNNLVVS
jgi:hypothetical protein